MQKKNYYKNKSNTVGATIYSNQKNNGITLIALIITIIVILILVAVSVRTIGKSGLFDHAKDATKKWSDAQNAEANINIDDYIEEINAPRFQKVASIDAYSIALDTEGNLWTWGSNRFGGLGDESPMTAKRNIPQKLTNLETTFKDISISVSSHSMALDKEGNIWTWGYNLEGQLGNGTKEKGSTPQMLAGLGTTFKKISAGGYHSVALDNSGNLWAWGYNRRGELGDGTTEDKLTPQKITGLETTFKEISAGDCHTVAIDPDGNIWTWGYNGNGELGDGTKNDRAIPQMLADLGTTFKKISAGPQHNLAIDIDGNIWSWGCNICGELGDGTTDDKLAPQKITGLGTTFKEISAGDMKSFAIDIDGNIWSWGDNWTGNLGDGTTEDKLTPQKLTGLGTTFKKVNSGYHCSLALDSNGIIYLTGVTSYDKDLICQTNESSNGTWEDLTTEEKYLAVELSPIVFTKWNKKITFIKTRTTSDARFFLDTEGIVWKFDLPK